MAPRLPGYRLAVGWAVAFLLGLGPAAEGCALTRALANTDGRDDVR
jgi:hypothetical protein